MKVKHTPGPWTVAGESQNYSESYVIEGIDKTICWVADSCTSNSDSETTEEDTANARLISKSPEMYALLHWAINEIETTPDELNDALLGLFKMKFEKLLKEVE